MSDPQLPDDASNPDRPGDDLPRHHEADPDQRHDVITPTPAAVLDGYFWERRRRGAVLPIAVGVLGLTALGLVQEVPVRHHLEQDLTARSALALHEAGVNGVNVRFSGRDATLTGTVAGPAQHDSAMAAVRHVTGVRVAHDRLARAAAPGTPGSAVRTAPQLSLRLQDGRLTLSGTVGSADARAALVAAARTALGTDRVSSRIGVNSRVADTGVSGLADVLAALGPDASATVDLSEGRITLAGVVSSPGRIQQAVAAATAATGSPQRVVVRLATDEPASVTAALGRLAAITFRTGYSTPSKADQAVIRQAAAILGANPSVRVQVAGFTDDTGPADINDNLSRARAQAVLRQLVRLGVPPSRLTLAAFGERNPKLPNTSAENRAANRRVELRVLP
jgi:outer membrane protein OmpA-like peptidoglycan-associated protein